MSSSSSCTNILYLLFTFIVFVLPTSAQQSTGACFTSIISFGDSISDTGNLIFALNNSHRVNRLPYGETFFHHPTGRFSDGRLIADFIANELGLPLLTPYLPYYGDGWSFRKGVNFAVAGSTALNDDFFNEKGIKLETKNISLDVQLKWFKDFLSFMCSSKEVCMEPSRHLSWDGLHFTEAAYRKIATGLLQGKYTNPPFTETCALLEPIGNLEFPRNTF
ncbi:hypothetical protein J5N97_004519 [Dioscorea zingiberensis]|uniref:GDSL esterase/lipase n=1 Tax=Dioscorea zingiberensis TaxID=325984 RepID=A0A9D5HRD9_9LILI|nr:hypothetical protein J5N97_004519 [Dioscorea zingiberensis]